MADLTAAPALQQRPERLLTNWRSIVIAFYICLFVALAFILADAEKFLHWFIVPVTLCGALIGADAVQWLRGRLDTFDPVGLLGLFGLHFFFLAPLLIVAWDYQLLYVPPLDDWRPWLGQMALLNLAGLALYRLSRHWIKPPSPGQPRRVWRLDGELFTIVLLFALVITFALQLAVYQQFGGLAGYINTFEERYIGEAGGFTGFGALFAISESFPYLFMLGYVVWARRKGGGWRAWGVVLFMLLVFFVVRLFFGGLRGSRSNTLFAMFWALTAIHVWLRPVPRRIFYGGAIFALLFMYVMGFYKAVGLDFVEVLQNPSSASQLEQETDRTFRAALLSDLSRAEIQPYLLAVLADPFSDYRYRWGSTYIGGLFTPVPRALWPTKPPTKVEAGSEAQHGSASFSRSGTLRSSRVYGLAGEAMLNFTPLAVPFTFVAWGLVVGWVQARFTIWPSDDTRRLLLPQLVLLCFIVLTADSDLITVFLVQQGLVMFLVIWLSSPQRKLRPAP